MVKKILLLLFICTALMVQKSFAWIYTVCNDTTDPVAVTIDYHFCYAEAPKIRSLAPKTCAIIDNSQSFFMNCLIDNVRFFTANKSTKLAYASGQSYFNPLTWNSYTYILTKTASGKPTVNITSGTNMPSGNRAVAVFKNYSGLGWKDWVAGVALIPNATMLITGATAVGGPLVGGAVGLGMGFVGLSSISVNAWKLAFNNCFRNGKYIVWVETEDTKNPSKTAQMLKSKTGCDEHCLPNPRVIDIDPATVCGYQLTDNLSDRFSYI